MQKACFKQKNNIFVSTLSQWVCFGETYKEVEICLIEKIKYENESVLVIMKNGDCYETSEVTFKDNNDQLPIHQYKYLELEKGNEVKRNTTSIYC